MDKNIQTLIETLESNNQDERAAAADDIFLMGPAGSDAVDALAMALDDQDQMVRMSAARALASIGPAAQMALPQLRALAEDDCEWRFVKVAAKVAVMMICDIEQAPTMDRWAVLCGLTLKELTPSVRR